MVNKTKEEKNQNTEDTHDPVNVVVNQPMRSSQENNSSSIEETKDTAGTRDFKNLGETCLVV